MNYKICLEIPDIAQDEEGRPAPAGLSIDMVSAADRKPTIEELQQALNIPGILKALCLDGIADPSKVRIMTEEEYMEKYWEEEPEDA